MLRLSDSDDGWGVAEVLGQELADAIGDEGLGAACVAAAELLDIHRPGEHPNVEGGHPVPEGVIVVECLIAAAQLGLGALTRQQLLDVFRRTETGHASGRAVTAGYAGRPRRCMARSRVAITLGSLGVVRSGDWS